MYLVAAQSFRVVSTAPLRLEQVQQELQFMKYYRAFKALGRGVIYKISHKLGAACGGQGIGSTAGRDRGEHETRRSSYPATQLSSVFFSVVCCLCCIAVSAVCRQGARPHSSCADSLASSLIKCDLILGLHAATANLAAHILPSGQSVEAFSVKAYQPRSLCVQTIHGGPLLWGAEMFSFVHYMLTTILASFSWLPVSPVAVAALP